jgi:hypothetical protein
MILMACNDEFAKRKPLERLLRNFYGYRGKGIQFQFNAIMSRLVKEGFNGKQSGMIGDGASDYAQAMG